MSRLGLRLAIVLRRYPWGWLACTLVLLGAVWLHFVHTPRLNAELDELRTAVVSSAVPVVPEAAVPQQTNLQLFQYNLLSIPDLPQVTAVLTEEAQRLHLVIERADYQMVRVTGGGFSGYRVTLPLKGEFGVLREFVMAVLQRLPSAALRNIKINRDSVGNPVVEAQMEWVVFCKDEELP